MPLQPKEHVVQKPLKGAQKRKGVAGGDAQPQGRLQAADAEYV